MTTRLKKEREENEINEFSSINLIINEIIFKIEIVNERIERNKNFIPSSNVSLLKTKEEDLKNFDFNSFTSRKHPPLVCTLCNKEGHLLIGMNDFHFICFLFSSIFLFPPLK